MPLLLRALQTFGSWRAMRALFAPAALILAG